MRMWAVDLEGHCEFTEVVLRVYPARFAQAVSVRLFGKEQILGSAVHVLTRLDLNLRN